MKAKEFINESEKKGLYYYVNKRKAAGTSRSASSPKAPTAQAWKDAAKTAKKEGVAEGKERCKQCGMTNCSCKPGTCKCKPIAGWIPNKGFKKAVDEGMFDSKPKVDWNKRAKELFAQGLNEQQHQGKHHLPSFTWSIQLHQNYEIYNKRSHAILTSTN
jgi:hypothetical protein